MSGIDRLAELRGNNPYDDDDGDDGASSLTSSELGQHMAKYSSIKQALNVIERNTDEVLKLRSSNKKAANEKSRREIMNKLENIMESTNKQGTLIKRQLDALKKENNEYENEHKDSAKAQARANLYQTHIRKFHEIMSEYNSAAHEFKQDLKTRTKREIQNVDKTISDEKAEELVDSGKAQDIIKDMLISDSMQETVRVIEERHLDILKLERQVLEIFELFKDLATLVDLQQESLDVIENRIMKAQNYTEKAEVELNEAEDYQKKARARRCCLLFILLAVLVAILAPTLLKTVGNA